MLTVGIVGHELVGSAIARYLLEHRPDMRLVLAGAGPGSRKAGRDVGVLLGLPSCGVPVVAAEELPAALRNSRPQAVIDFSRPDGTIALLRHYAAIGCGVVVGTTGFSETQLARLRRAPGTRKFGLIYAPDITHRSESGPAFAADVIEAAVWIARRRGFFTMEEMIMQEETHALLVASAEPELSEPLPARIPCNTNCL